MPQRKQGRGRFLQWASRAGHDGQRRRPVLRWAYENACALETKVADAARRNRTGAIDPGNVTLVLKTFERPAVLGRMLRSVRRVYGGPVIIADDSRVPFVTDDPLVRVLRMPFDSGIGAGRNALLDAVDTEFVFLADDDMHLMPDFDLARPLAYLERNAEVDVVGGRVIHLPLWRTADYSSARLYAYRGEPRVREGVVIDGLPVSYKVPNFYVARTERVRAVGYDDQLKRQDHNDFFTSAYGELVCVIDRAMVCLHAHSFFDAHYQSFRMDTSADAAYLAQKWSGERADEVVAAVADAPSARQLAVLHHAAVETVAGDLGVRVLHHGTPDDAAVSVSVVGPGADALLDALRTMGWSGSGRKLTHGLWGELRVDARDVAGAEVPASFATITGLADNDTWPAPIEGREVPRTTGSPESDAELDLVRWHPRAGWVDDGDVLFGATLPLGPVRRIEFPGDLIWEAVGVEGSATEQVVADVLEAFEDAPPEAAGQIRDFLDALVAQGLLERQALNASPSATTRCE
ncbi:PqqD family peptide modification chaperone [Granulicoccus sp. GXG6511]|uniref:PqqD family peptide modification chaperone n=1 Tax=Granulicoccus sp. GXG6511 TaxID=3381351 RepID=UPI003D7EEC5C